MDEEEEILEKYLQTVDQNVISKLNVASGKQIGGASLFDFFLRNKQKKGTQQYQLLAATQSLSFFNVQNRLYVCGQDSTS